MKFKRNLNFATKKFFDNIKEQIIFEAHYPKASELLFYFKNEMKAARRILTPQNIIKSQEAAVEMIISYEHISVDEWKKAISWLLHNQSSSREWWGRVPINHLKTIISLYNIYLQYNDEKKDERRRYHDY